MSQNDRAARILEQSGKAFESGEMIKAKLDRMIAAIVKASEFAKTNGRLSPDEQFGVRVIRSLQRAVDRDWLATFGIGRPKMIAEMELKLAKPDNGALIRLGEKMHAQGRFSCRACATKEEEGAMFPVPANKLCAACGAGVEHVWDVQEIPIPSLPVGDGLATVPEGGQPTENMVLTRHFCCDNCGHLEVVTL